MLITVAPFCCFHVGECSSRPASLHSGLMYDAMMHQPGYVMTNERQIFHMETMDILNYYNILPELAHLEWGGFVSCNSNNCFLFIVPKGRLQKKKSIISDIVTIRSQTYPTHHN